MINLPDSTLFNKRIPKQKFYNHLKVSPALERQFVKEIENIVWLHKLSPETLNIEKGESVSEIEVIEIRLKTGTIGKNLVVLIDREIPYHLMFLMTYQNKGQLWISYKEASKSRNNKFRVEHYFQTEWVDVCELSLSLTGLTLDAVYENFLKQIAGDQLKLSETTELKTAVELTKEINYLETQIEQIENKIKKEIQYNRQVKLHSKLRQLKEKLNAYHTDER